MISPTLHHRRSVLAGGVALLAAGGASAAARVRQRPNEPGPYDLVIRGGRVVDPETGFDAVRNVGLRKGRIAAISEAALSAPVVADAQGCVVAPGFIDLHAHGQYLPAARMQAFDGVTTALELERGTLPISRFYREVELEGRPINYGASASWMHARTSVVTGTALDRPDLRSLLATIASNRASLTATLDPAQMDRVLDLIRTGLSDGGIGIGIPAGYASGLDAKEYYALAKLAAARGVPTFTHTRGGSLGSFLALEEIVAVAAATGAQMHICHVNTAAGRDIVAYAAFLQAAAARGVRVTTEAYPYGAGSTSVGAQFIRNNNAKHTGAARDQPTNIELRGKRLTPREVDDLIQRAPGTFVIVRDFDESNPQDRALMDVSLLLPKAAIASDGVEWVAPNGAYVEGDVWPIPPDATSHPRSAGCFSRFLAIWVRERKAITLTEALRKMSLIPAQILETSVPQMRTKGRVQVGADADLTVFDLQRVQDRATYDAPVQTSVGHRYVIVDGVPVIWDGELRRDARPGKPIRRTGGLPVASPNE